MITYSQVIGGKFQNNARAQIVEFLKAMEGKHITITIEVKRSKRSQAQNAYYFGCIIPIIKDRLKELGNVFTNEQVHEDLKKRFLSEDIHLKDGEFISRIKSTSSLNKLEFMDYIANIQQFAADVLDLYIPDPNEQTQINLTT